MADLFSRLTFIRRSPKVPSGVGERPTDYPRSRLHPRRLDPSKTSARPRQDLSKTSAKPLTSLALLGGDMRSRSKLMVGCAAITAAALNLALIAPANADI